MRFYLAGKISDTTDYRERFFDAAHELRLRGHDVVNPVELNWALIQSGKGSWQEYMRADIRELMTCKGICLLPDWMESKGARFEFSIATQVGIPSVMYREVVSYAPHHKIDWVADNGLLLQASVHTAEELIAVLHETSVLR